MTIEPTYHNNEAFQKQQDQSRAEHEEVVAQLRGMVHNDREREKVNRAIDLIDKLKDRDVWKRMAIQLDNKVIDEQRDHIKTCGYHDATKAQLALFEKRGMELHREVGEVSARYAELSKLNREFFGYLDRTEESDEGREFHPVTFGCCRAMWVDDINRIMTRMKELSK